jgi:hypothetical protein
MPLDLVGAAIVGPDRKAGAAPRCVDAHGLELDLIVKVLQRDDPLRRSYLQRRWHLQAAGRCNERTTSSAIALSRR